MHPIAGRQQTLWQLVGRGLVPVAVFVAMATLTFLVWREQVQHQRSLLSRHTEDVCAQASRRLEVFMESHVRVASIFAQRWSTHETRDFSKKRFAESASVLVRELPGYHGVGLIPPDGGPGWAVPEDAWIAKGFLEPERWEVIEEALRVYPVVLSDPFEHEPGNRGLWAVLPLKRGEESLGYLVAEFQVEDLINDCFHTRIRSEFHFMVQDGAQVLFRSSAETEGLRFREKSTLASREFPVHNRTWRLTMVPRAETAAAFGWTANLAVLLFGVVLSVGLSWLVYVLLRRMEMFRAARNQQAMLSRKVLLAQEEERSRLSRELHDELGQLLTATRLEMGWLEKRIPSGAEESSVFRNTVVLIEQATDELRRMCRGLRPPLLDDLGLEPAARLLVEEFEERAGVKVDLDLGLDEEETHIPQEVALCVYRILQESLTNVSRHARATWVRVSLRATSKELTLKVFDNGVGYDVTRLSEVQGYGLEGMRERANLAGGTLEIRSARNQGTSVLVLIPLVGPDEEKKP